MQKTNMINMMTSSQNTRNTIKPYQDIQRMIDAFKPHARVHVRRDIHSLNSIDFHKRQCFLLHTGYVSLCRERDGLVINSEGAPFIFGFSDLCQTTQNITIYPAQDAILSSLPLEKAYEIVSKQDQWQPLAKLLMFISHRIYEHCTRTSQFNSYQTIRALLLDFHGEPRALQASTPILQYIQSRCFLSRSGILRILAALRSGHYISIENGRLLEINGLPLKF